jgi:hypothetical protein
MTDQERLERAREQLEVLFSIPFVVQEVGLGADERDAWEAGTLLELQTLLGARRTCMACGAKDGEPHADECIATEEIQQHD